MPGSVTTGRKNCADRDHASALQFRLAGDPDNNAPARIVQADRLAKCGEQE
jgi:hypothetical protein